MERKIILEQLKNKLTEITFYEAYWYPLNKLKVDIPVLAYNIDTIYKQNHIDYLESVLERCKICKVIKVHLERGVVVENLNLLNLLKEKDEEGYQFPWCTETYYFDEKKDWMIYVSHEGSITFAGTKIVELAKEIIPENYIY